MLARIAGIQRERPEKAHGINAAIAPAASWVFGEIYGAIDPRCEIGVRLPAARGVIQGPGGDSNEFPRRRADDANITSRSTNAGFGVIWMFMSSEATVNQQP